MKYWISIILLLNSTFTLGQTRIVFWNVENAFDTLNDLRKNDDEFTPNGIRHWNGYRYKKKIEHLSQTLVSIGEWNVPMLIGLCEIENRTVLFDITQYSILRKASYQIIHFESADRRGIDPAFLYDPNQIQVFESGIIPLVYEGDSLRHILWLIGKTNRGDTLLTYMNHWPSKYSGVQATIPKRMFAAEKLIEHKRSMEERYPGVLIIAGGDFNDELFEPSVQTLLKNEFHATSVNEKLGTHKFREKWSLIDLIFFNSKAKEIIKGKQEIYTHKNLLVEDDNYLGLKPFRTYVGFRYTGGYSDHLPVYIELYK